MAEMLAERTGATPGEYDEIGRPHGLAFGPGNGRSGKKARDTDPLYPLRVRARWAAFAWFEGLGRAVQVGPSRRRASEASNDVYWRRGKLEATLGVRDFWVGIDRGAPRRAVDQRGY